MTREERKEMIEALLVAFLVASFIAALVGLGYIWRDQACMSDARLAQILRNE